MCRLLGATGYQSSAKTAVVTHTSSIQTVLRSGSCDLGGKEVQIAGSLLQKLWLGVLAEGRQHLAVSPLGIQPDGAVWAAGNDTHTAPLAAELHHVEHVKGGLVTQHAQRDALHGAA